MKKFDLLFLVTFSGFLCACATPETSSLTDSNSSAPSAPSYLMSSKGCAVLLGGSVGSAFSDPETADFWHKGHVKIASEIHMNLTAANYKVVKVIVQPSENTSIEQIAFREIGRNGCNHLLQISFDANQDTLGPYFQYDFQLLKMEPNGKSDPANRAIGVVARGKYRRDYRYSRTIETLETFSISSFARQAYHDMEASGALEALR